ncbi:MAG: zinc-binding dehydrogenase [Propionibacteriales bacterium]|nr:zinc-binding dehydrogenase [Propionibacteriales bacterium]
MHAVRLHSFGPAENLRLEEVPDPEPAAGEVRIAVAAAGVHLVDTTIRAGDAPGPFALPELPTIPGREVSGTVESVGAGVDRSWLGRRVVAHLGQASAGYAEQAVAAVESLHEVPDGLDHAVAVAAIGTGRTAVAILEQAAPTADDVMLVTSAAGGLGSLFVQAGREVGATVVGLAGGPAKVDRVRDLGADLAVNYLKPGWDRQVRDTLGEREVTLVLDGVGGEAGRTALELVAPGGRIVFFGWSSGKPTTLSMMDLYTYGFTASVAIGRRLTQRPGGLRSLETEALQAAASGRLVPVVQPFPLADAARAHRALETRGTIGKVVLVT